MADELTISEATTYVKNGITLPIPAESVKVSVSGNGLIQNVQLIGTSMEALLLGEVTTPGFFRIKNLDATNYVEVGVDSGGFVPFLKLLPGQVARGFFSTSAPQAKANTAAVKVLCMIADV